jgi:hypothetical protein
MDQAVRSTEIRRVPVEMFGERGGSGRGPPTNPIEHCWHTLKSRLKPLIQQDSSNLQKVIGGCLLTI